MHKWRTKCIHFRQITIIIEESVVNVFAITGLKSKAAKNVVTTLSISFKINLLFSPDKMVCLSRGLLGTDIFRRKILQTRYDFYENQRRNLNRLISSNSEGIQCNGTEYSFAELCRIRDLTRTLGSESKPCHVNDISLDL